MFRTIFCLAISLLVSTPGASAADETTCADQFKAADHNNDGMLSRTEIGNAKGNVPAAVSKRDQITRTDFMAACTNSI